jgi:transposase
MGSSIVLRGGQRNRLLKLYRNSPQPGVRLRAHIILLLADGCAWGLIATMLFCSSATIARWQKAFVAGGIDALLEEKRGRPSTLGQTWKGILVLWVQQHTPRAFGFLRSRWCCATLVLVLLETWHLQVSIETVRRALHAQGMVWRRPRPTLELEDPQWKPKMRKLRKLLRHLPDDEIAVFLDEVDISTNPKVGSMWMCKGHQAQLPTPGDSVKRYLCGSMDWRTGQIITTEGQRRDKNLFLAHLDDLRRHYRCYKKIHVICDNARFHCPEQTKAVAEYLETWKEQLELHFLPKRAPETNPIERVWWHLHQQITRNHRCPNIRQLVDLTLQWLQESGPFQFDSHLYRDLQAALAKR